MQVPVNSRRFPQTDREPNSIGTYDTGSVGDGWEKENACKRSWFSCGDKVPADLMRRSPLLTATTGTIETLADLKIMRPGSGSNQRQCP